MEKRFCLNKLAEMSQSLHDVDHSTDIREMLKHYCIGDIHTDDCKKQGSKDQNRSSLG